MKSIVYAPGVVVIPGPDTRSVTNEDHSYRHPRADISHHGISSQPVIYSVPEDPGYAPMKALLALILFFDIAMSVFAVWFWR